MAPVPWAGDQTRTDLSGHLLTPYVFSNEENKILRGQEQSLSDIKGALGHFSFFKAPCILKQKKQLQTRHKNCGISYIL